MDLLDALEHKFVNANCLNLKVKNFPNLFRFASIFLFSYFVLTISLFVDPFKDLGVSIYNTFQGATFNVFHPTTRTDFRFYEGESPEQYDYSVYIFSKEEWKSSPRKKMLQPMFIMNQNARTTALGPFILLFSLIVASPITWRRKLIALIVGGIILYIILSMKYTTMFYENAESLRPAGFSLWVSISRLFSGAFRTQEFLSIIIIPIWAIVSLRKQDWKWFIS